jgi:TPR repeat protein
LAKDCGMRVALWTLGAFILALSLSAPAQADALRERTIVLRTYHGSVARLLAAAERGDARAQTRLGFMHETGDRVPQDFVMAASWYRRAAESGEPNAQYLLGVLYDKGFGVQQDYIEAHKWLNLAAAHSSARNREYYSRMRNAVASKMGTGELVNAQWRASSWYPKRVW